MSLDLTKQAEFAVEAAKKAGADESWVTASESRDVEFSYREGKLEKVKDATSLALSIKLYVDHRYSSHSTTDLRPAQVSAFISEAVALTRALEQDKYRKITPPALFANRSENDLQLLDPALTKLTREQRLRWCEELDAFSHTDERLISATSAVYDGIARSVTTSSNGFSGSEASTYLWLGSELTFRDKGDRRPNSYFYAGAPQQEDVPKPELIAKEALSRVRARLGSEKGPTMKTTMVVDRSIASSLIGRLMRPATGGALQQGRSFWTNYLDSKPFSDKLTILDDPLVVRGLGSRHYDSEGISAKPISMIENGVVKNFYIDTYYGHKLGKAPTTGSSSNRIIRPGGRSLSELISAAGEGVYVTSWLGGNADDTTGEFSLGLRGHLIENGKIGAPVDEMNVTGDLESLFAGLAEVGNDPWQFSGTRCPTLLFENVSFSGA